MEEGVGKWVSYLNREKKLDSQVGRRPAAPPAPKGLYLYGNVGSGTIASFLIMLHGCSYMLYKFISSSFSIMMKIFFY